MEAQRNRPIAVFMAFGTKGDVFPIAAIAAAFACDQMNYEVNFITHTFHQDLTMHLSERNVELSIVSAPPVLSPPKNDDSSNSVSLPFSIQKRTITKKHRQECLSIMEKIFKDGSSLNGDFVVINFFALEGWSLAELFCIWCVLVAPYVVPYAAPSSFEQQFTRELPLLYQYLQEAPIDKLCWNDIIHWMWPLFSEDYGSWRRDELNLSPLPFTDPVTELPMWHDQPPSPLLLYGFSREIVECPDYWPSNARVCGFWFLPPEWQFSCNDCRDTFDLKNELCATHMDLQCFLNTDTSMPLVFVGLSSIGSMGFMSNPKAFLCILRGALETVPCRFILLTAGYQPLDLQVQIFAAKENSSYSGQKSSQASGISLFHDRLFCFGGSIPYTWLFRKCAVVVHHGGSGSTAAALKTGIPQIICPCMLDQFYWAERMFWLGVAAEPLKRTHLLPESCDDMTIKEGVNMISNAIKYALGPNVKTRALEICGRILQEDGVSEAVKILDDEMS